MPQSINGIPLTDHEHRIWNEVFQRTKDGAQATAAVQKFRAARKKSRPRR